jgi:hypothetical protein
MPRYSAKTPIVLVHEIQRPIGDLFVPLRHADLRANRTPAERPPGAAWGSRGIPPPSALPACRQVELSPGRILIRILISHWTGFTDRHSDEAFRASPE